MAAAFAGGNLLLWTVVYGATLAAARLPAHESGVLVVVFSPSRNEAEALHAIAVAGGRLVAGTGFRWLWRVADDEPGFVGRLERAGAVAAFRELPAGPSLAGCTVLLAPLAGARPMAVLR